MSPRQDDLTRIEGALQAAREILARFTPGAVAAEQKAPGDPVTEADRAVDETLRGLLPRGDEGWLSEETTDDPGRFGRSRVWVVDPLDGTREFVKGIPEWAVSIGLVEDGEPVAGGVCNPTTNETIVGSRDSGVLLNGRPVAVSARQGLSGAKVLASRSEVGRGEWERFGAGPFEIRAMGSVAYKLALVAAGLAEATWTLVPKHEWDVAAGVALVRAAGGSVQAWPEPDLRFNRRDPLLRGLVAGSPGVYDEIVALLTS